MKTPKALNAEASSQPEDSNQQAAKNEQQPETYSCGNCKSYLPLLKSFILHLESSHKVAAADGSPEKYQCEVCQAEFESSIVLGKHSLVHASGTSTATAACNGAESMQKQGGIFIPFIYYYYFYIIQYRSRDGL